MINIRVSRSAGFVRVGASLIVSAAVLLGAAQPAHASTSTSIGVAAATSYGFKCDAANHWLHQNWPDISVRSTENQDVYVRALLYRWNGQGWDKVQVSDWYIGESTVDGSQVLGYTVGGLPYSFAVPGTPSTVPANDGYGFDDLTPGYYATVEEYQAAGRTWSANNTVQGDPATFCQA